MSEPEIIKNLVAGETARLIPVASERQKEARAVSPLLAVFRLVPDYANMMLAEVGAPTNQRAKLTAYTEVCFKTKGKKPSELPRPDGLLFVESGSKTWSALIEAKVKGAEMTAEQLEQYLDLAREVGANALITISNQFALLPTHHPVRVNKQKTRSVDLYHFSWLSLLCNAQILSDSASVNDREQAMVLKEMIRFLEHENSGVQVFERMGSAWKDLCAGMQRGEPLKKGDALLQLAIADWHQLTRYLALKLSTRLAKSVKLHMSRKHLKDPGARLNDDMDGLLRSHCLADEFEIPNAAGRIALTADLLRRTIKLSMKLDPPQDKKRPTAAINWLTKQLDREKAKDVFIKCEWPGRISETMLPLAAALEDPSDLVPDGVVALPKSVEVMRVLDLAGRFKGARTLVEDVEKAFPAFYRDIGQDLKPWTPSPPKYRKTDSTDDIAQLGLDREDVAPIANGLTNEDRSVDAQAEGESVN